MIRIRSDLVSTQECISIHIGIDPEGFSPVSISWFGDLAVWWTPFRIGHFALQLPDFTYVSPTFDQLVWLNYACPCILQLQEGYVRVRRAGTENMESPTILVLYLQGSDAGQKCLKI